MSEEPRQTLGALPAPTPRERSRFWRGDTEYVLQPDGERWMLYEMHPPTATPMITLELRPDGSWFGMEVNGFDKYTGATHIDVLRQVT